MLCVCDCPYATFPKYFTVHLVKLLLVNRIIPNIEDSVDTATFITKLDLLEG